MVGCVGGVWEERRLEGSEGGEGGRGRGEKEERRAVWGGFGCSRWFRVVRWVVGCGLMVLGCSLLVVGIVHGAVPGVVLAGVPGLLVVVLVLVVLVVGRGGW